jgi:hypothetical protein
MVGVIAAIVADRGPDTFREFGKPEQELLKPHGSHRTVVLHGRVQGDDGRAVVPVVMKLHGACVDVRLERVRGVRQRIEVERTRRLLGIAAA